MPASSTWIITSVCVVSYAGCVGVARSAAAVVSSKATGHPLGSNFHRYFSALRGCIFHEIHGEVSRVFIINFMKNTVYIS